MVNRERLAETFKNLVQIDSVSKNESAMAKALSEILESMGADVFIDNAGSETGSNTGNLFPLKGDLFVPYCGRHFRRRSGNASQSRGSGRVYFELFEAAGDGQHDKKAKEDTGDLPHHR